MRRQLLTAFVLLAALTALPAPALGAEPSDYNFEEASIELSDTQAGAHPDLTTKIRFSTTETGAPVSLTRDVFVRLPAGIVGNPQAFPQCTSLQLGFHVAGSECPPDSQIGSTEILTPLGTFGGPVYNMTAPGGDVAARFGFFAGFASVILNVRLDPETQTLVASVEGANSTTEVIGVVTTLWGVPSDDSHDLERITPLEGWEHIPPPPGGRPSSLPPTPFMTNPTSCEAREAKVIARPYLWPESPAEKTIPFPQITGCGALEFKPVTDVKLSTSQGTSATGLSYGMTLPTKGLELDNVLYDSMMKRTEVTLPEGMTVNPSAAEGLGVCSEADLARERYDSLPNVGCPESSKIGSVIAKSPIIDRDAVGGLYLAKPYENPFGALLGLYLVVKIPDRGVLTKVPGVVEPDPRTGQLITTFDDVPQLPVQSVDLSFREGARAPLITPPDCGGHEAISNISPWAKPASFVTKRNALAINSGPGHGPCPTGGVPPFHPGFLAGSLNNTAGSYSPFNMRLTREDEDQDLTKLSATLPKGMIGKLAGVDKCPEAGIAQARSRTGPREGRLELSSPSCPPNSEIGNVLAGAGVGSVLTYATGKVYLAGPYKGAPLSVVGVVPAVAGPFDVGTVVARQALRVDPRTAEVKVDGSASDPFPHILAGIPLKVRDVRVYVDRENFTLNPTSCKESFAEATMWGGGVDVFGSADDMPFGATSRFQAAECAALGFKPKLGITLRGGTGRGGHPALRGVYRPRAGDANLKGLVLRLPRSAFLDQAHIRTICTRVQFAANGGNGGGCPAGSVYGKARAITPLLDEPLEGPVYLRSSNNKLPDFVAALHGLVDVEAVARVDSVRGGIRATFSNLPDAPITKVVVDMQGQQKGLIVNSRNLCAGTNRAEAAFGGQNGRRAKSKSPVRAAGCGKSRARR
jgi:hypothetical protein